MTCTGVKLWWLRGMEAERGNPPQSDTITNIVAATITDTSKHENNTKSCIL